MNHRYALGIIFMFLIFAAGCGAADPEQISMEETTGFHTLDPEQLAEIMEEALDDEDSDSKSQGPTKVDLAEANPDSVKKPPLFESSTGQKNSILTATTTATPQLVESASPTFGAQANDSGTLSSAPQIDVEQLPTKVGFKIPSQEESEGVFSASATTDDEPRETEQAGTYELENNTVTYHYLDDCEENDRDCSDD